MLGQLKRSEMPDPTGSVYISFEVLNVNASKNSFQAAKKLNNAVTAIAGVDRGNTTFVNTWNWLHPSRAAASSSSRGMVSKNPFNIQTQRGKAVTQ